jgi:hypothetical protein
MLASHNISRASWRCCRFGAPITKRTLPHPPSERSSLCALIDSSRHARFKVATHVAGDVPAAAPPPHDIAPDDAGSMSNGPTFTQEDVLEAMSAAGERMFLEVTAGGEGHPLRMAWRGVEYAAAPGSTSDGDGSWTLQPIGTQRLLLRVTCGLRPRAPGSHALLPGG